MRRKLNVKLVAGTLVGLLALSACAYAMHEYQVRRNANGLLERGDRAFEAKDYAKAELSYAQYLKIVPNDADATRKYAQALDRSAVDVGDRLHLVVVMEQVLRMQPNQDELRLRLIHNLIALGRYPEAAAHARTRLTSAQDKGDAHHLLGWCLEASKEFEPATKEFEKAIQLKPKKRESYALLTEVLEERLHQPAAALKVMNELVRNNSEVYQAYLMRARFQRNHSDEKAAEADLQTAYKLKPDEPEVIFAVADAARGRGQWDQAVELLTAGVARWPGNADFYRLLAVGEIQQGRRDAAIAHLHEGLRRVPKAADLSLLLIDLLIDQKQYAEARAKIVDLTDVRPTLSKYLMARLRIADKQWSEAIKLLEAVRPELAPKSEWHSRVDALLGLCYRQIGDGEQELHAFRRAVQAESTWLVASVGLGAALLDNGLIEEASQTLEPLLKSSDVPAGYWVLLTRSRLARQMRLPQEQRRWDEVEAALTKAGETEPKSADVSAVRAELLAAQRSFDEAKAALEKALAEHPDDIAVWCALADLQVRQNHFEEAEKILAQAAEPSAFGDRIELRVARCRLWGSRGNDADLAKLAQLGSGLPSSYSVEERAQLWRALAETWSRRGEQRRAGELWTALASALPRDVRSRFALVEIAVQKSDGAAARKNLEELRAVEGEHGSFVLFAEAAILVREAHGQSSKLAEARKKLAELEATHKDWPRLPLLAAAISEREGKHPQAIEEYTRALDLGDSQPRTLARLLELLLQRREFSKAETEVTKYEQKQTLTSELARLGAEVAVGLRDKLPAQIAVKRAGLAVTLPSRDYRDYLWLARSIALPARLPKRRSCCSPRSIWPAMPPTPGSPGWNTSPRPTSAAEPSRNWIASRRSCPPIASR